MKAARSDPVPVAEELHGAQDGQCPVEGLLDAGQRPGRLLPRERQERHDAGLSVPELLGPENVPAGLFRNFESVTIITQMFENCTSLRSLPVEMFDNMRKITTATSAFNGCSAFTGESPYTMVEGEKVHLYERSTANGFSAVTKYTDCFEGCTQMADYANIPQAWGGISDGTKAKPTLTLSMAPQAGAGILPLRHHDPRHGGQAEQICPRNDGDRPKASRGVRRRLRTPLQPLRHHVQQFGRFEDQLRDGTSGLLGRPGGRHRLHACRSGQQRPRHDDRNLR